MPTSKLRRLTHPFCVLLVTLTAACTSLPDNPQRTPSSVHPTTSDSRLHRDLVPLLKANPEHSGFYSLPVGEDAFIVRAALISQADVSLDVQYYMWRQDLTGNVLLYALMQAAERGVRVRLLLDDLNTAGMDPALRALNAIDNVEVRLFNPFANRSHRGSDLVTSASRINHRMHNKTLTVDGIATVFGGRNIGDEYFAANTDLLFGDMDALAIGPIATDVGHQFDQFWNSDHSYPVSAFYAQDPTQAEVAAYRASLNQQFTAAKASQYAAALEQMAILQQQHFSNLPYAWSDWVLAFDQPEKITAANITAATHLFPKLKRGMDSAQQDLLIVSPYFIPGDKLTAYLIDRVRDGVRVRILTNSLMSNDVAAVHAGYARYRKALVEGGVELYELRADLGQRLGAGDMAVAADKSSLHAKFMIFDEQWLWVGSYNMDGRSTIYNTEFGAYFADPANARLQSQRFDELAGEVAYRVELDAKGKLNWVTVRDGTEQRLDREPDTSWWDRATNATLRLIIPESLF